MDLEELTTTQIVLLVLLVSFVTSIATGIVTVSLLSQAPPAITQTVNRVVERTVETIVPKDSGSQIVTTKETTVVVKEEDLVTASISSSLLKTGRVFSDTSSSSPVIALAAAIGPGTLISDRNVAEGEHLIAIGNQFHLFKVSERYAAIGVTVLTPVSTSTTLTNTFKVGDTSAVKLGQTAVALMSVTQERVAIGAVTAKQEFDEVTGKGGAVMVRALETNIDEALIAGVPLVNVFGDLIGISTVVTERGAFISASDIAGLLAPKASSTPSN